MGKFLNADLLDKAEEVEKLLVQIPQITKVEDIAEHLGCLKIKTTTETEIFEFENGAEFINSPLVADFLLPSWLAFLDDEEQERVRRELTQIIDDNAEDLTFRFTVKATLFNGEKA